MDGFVWMAMEVKVGMRGAMMGFGLWYIMGFTVGKGGFFGRGWEDGGWDGRGRRRGGGGELCVDEEVVMWFVHWDWDWDYREGWVFIGGDGGDDGGDVDGEGWVVGRAEGRMGDGGWGMGW